MRLVILAETNTVGKDNVIYDNLDLSSCGLPENLWALQWNDNNTGHIEYNSPIDNDPITELPSWAQACLIKYEERAAEIAVEEAKAKDLANIKDFFIEETFWDEQNYPEANIKDVEWLIANAPIGVTLTKMYNKFEYGSKIIGVHFDEVLSNASGDGLKGMNNTIQIANNIGVPCFASRSNVWSETFCRYLSENGWTIFENSKKLYKTAYRAWTLDLHKTYKKRLINVERDASIKNGYNDGTNTWDIDSQSMTNLTSKTVGLADNDSVTWRTKTNANVTMTGVEFKTLVQNAVAAVDTIYQDSWTRKSAVDSAISRESVDIV